MVRFRTSVTPERERSRINGAVYPPLVVKRFEQAVATKDAAIRLKLQMLRLVA